MKKLRHSRILEIIADNSIETQDDLLTILKNEGYKATQATISRDIKDLRLVKTLDSDGKYRYISAEKNTSDSFTGFSALLLSALKSIDYAQNIVVIKTNSGMAQAICASLDELNYSSIVGTIAGEDTIFIVCKTTELAINLMNELKKLI
jgi:transcriptional regulator of arginine metabolism